MHNYSYIMHVSSVSNKNNKNTVNQNNNITIIDDNELIDIILDNIDFKKITPVKNNLLIIIIHY